MRTIPPSNNRIVAVELLVQFFNSLVKYPSDSTVSRRQRRERIAERYAPSFESTLDKKQRITYWERFLDEGAAPAFVLLCIVRVLSLFLPLHQRALAPICRWL